MAEQRLSLSPSRVLLVSMPIHCHLNTSPKVVCHVQRLLPTTAILRPTQFLPELEVIIPEYLPALVGAPGGPASGALLCVSRNSARLSGSRACIG